MISTGTFGHCAAERVPLQTSPVRERFSWKKSQAKLNDTKDHYKSFTPRKSSNFNFRIVRKPFRPDTSHAAQSPEPIAPSTPNQKSSVSSCTSPGSPSGFIDSAYASLDSSPSNLQDHTGCKHHSSNSTPVYQCPTIPRFSWQDRTSILSLACYLPKSNPADSTATASFRGIQLVQSPSARDTCVGRLLHVSHRRPNIYKIPRAHRFSIHPPVQDILAMAEMANPLSNRIPDLERQEGPAFSFLTAKPNSESPSRSLPLQPPYESPKKPRGQNANSSKISAAPPDHSPIAGVSSIADGIAHNLSGLVCNMHRTTGNEPPALVGASTTIVGDKLYVFGGRRSSHRRPHLTRRLYELDLVRRHWTRLETTGKAPSPRYFHSICALGDTKLVCYGGMAHVLPDRKSVDPRASAQTEQNMSVMSDIHMYDIPTQVWTFISPTVTSTTTTTTNASSVPPGRYAHCATILPSSGVFSSATAPYSAIRHNPQAPSNPNTGTLGVAIDGTGGAEMVVVGGQDSNSQYIEQISVFNLRSLQWTTSTPLGRQCGAYRSVVIPLLDIKASALGSYNADVPIANGFEAETGDDGDATEGSMLIYSNYNFLDVKLELQVRLPNGRLVEKQMPARSQHQMPPGLRFPTGGIINGHFLVSGTFLTSSKQEYALWALNLKSLTWSRVDMGVIFASGSWNRGLLWKKRNCAVVLGNRKRSLGEDYHSRRLNFANMCVVELQAFGLFENECKTSTPASRSAAPPAPKNMITSVIPPAPEPSPMEKLGQLMTGREFSDMEILALGGERVPINSRVVASKWGPFFHHLIHESLARDDNIDDTSSIAGSKLTSRLNNVKRHSGTTITPSIRTAFSNATTVVPLSESGSSITAVETNTTSQTHAHASNVREDYQYLAPTADHSLIYPASSSPLKRARLLYLPHTVLTIRALVHYLYTSSLPHRSSPLCSPQILCSLLQLARPYRIHGLLEATLERLHEVLDSRNIAAVFNAAAMAIGGGDSIGSLIGSEGLEIFPMPPKGRTGPGAVKHSVVPRARMRRAELMRSMSNGRADLPRAAAPAGGEQPERPASHGNGDVSGAESASSVSDVGSESEAGDNRAGPVEQEIWSGEPSAVVGLQKRGLRGLMEGRIRHTREREHEATAAHKGKSRATGDFFAFGSPESVGRGGSGGAAATGNVDIG